MASYTVSILPKAQKQLATIPQSAREDITAAIDALSDNPKPRGAKKLKGEHAGLWRIRVGDYRVVYSVEDKILLVTVVWIGQRGGAYR